MILMLIAACYMAYLGFTAETAPQQASLAGFACFFGILARIAQAELHDEENDEREKNKTTHT